MERQTALGASILGGAIVGASLMYVLDPASGRRRRGLARDKLIHVASQIGEGARVTAIDMAHRARGIVATASSLGHRRGRPHTFAGRRCDNVPAPCFAPYCVRLSLDRTEGVMHVWTVYRLR